VLGSPATVADFLRSLRGTARVLLVALLGVPLGDRRSGAGFGRSPNRQPTRRLLALEIPRFGKSNPKHTGDTGWWCSLFLSAGQHYTQNPFARRRLIIITVDKTWSAPWCAAAAAAVPARLSSTRLPQTTPGDNNILRFPCNALFARWGRVHARRATSCPRLALIGLETGPGWDGKTETTCRLLIAYGVRGAINFCSPSSLVAAHRQRPADFLFPRRTRRLRCERGRGEYYDVTALSLSLA
jgi:hypothetical protein